MIGKAFTLWLATHAFVAMIAWWNGLLAGRLAERRRQSHIRALERHFQDDLDWLVFLGRERPYDWAAADSGLADRRTGS